MSGEELRGGDGKDHVAIRSEIIEVDNESQWSVLTRSCQVDLANLRAEHGLADHPDVELVLPISDFDGTLVSKSAGHVEVRAITDESTQDSLGGKVTILEGVFPPDAEPIISARAEDGELRPVDINDAGVMEAAGLLRLLVEVSHPMLEEDE